jgi:hypothetical protein
MIVFLARKTIILLLGGNGGPLLGAVQFDGVIFEEDVGGAVPCDPETDFRSHAGKGGGGGGQPVGDDDDVAPLGAPLGRARDLPRPLVPLNQEPGYSCR